MPSIPIKQAQVGMKLDKDVYSGTGLKLAVRGMVLTQNQIQVLIKYNVRSIEVEAVSEPASESGEPKTDEHDSIQGKRKDALSHVLRGIPIFESLTDDHMELLMANFRIVRHHARTVLFEEGDPGDAFYVVLKGAIKIYISKQGGEKTLSVFRAGDSFGELSLLDGKPRSASAQTLQRTELLVISQDNFMKLLSGHFDIAHMIMRNIIQRLFDTHRHMTELTLFDARTRVTKALIQMASRHGKRTEDGIEVELPLDLPELAQMVGVKPSELQQVLNDLERKQLIRMDAGHGHFVLNLQKLRSDR